MGYSFIQYKDNSNELLSTLEIYTLPGHYDEMKQSQIINTFKNSVDVNDLLIVNLLDYDTSYPENWLHQTQQWNKILTSSTIKLLTVVINKSKFIEIDHEIHEFIQANLRIQAMILGSSIQYISSFSSISSSNTKSIKIISYLLQTPMLNNSTPTIEQITNHLDLSNVIIPYGSDHLNMLNVLFPQSSTLYENYKSYNQQDGMNPVIKNYHDTVMPHFEEIRGIRYPDSVDLNESKKQTNKEKTAKPVDYRYNDFLENVYANRMKETKELLTVLGLK